MAAIKVKVVVPIYKKRLGDRELRSFLNNAEVLARYPMVPLAPEGLDISATTQLAPQAEVMRVSKNWLGEKGIAGYNDMMMSKSFYQLFEDCDYILICQTDAWIFRDELEQWCDGGYDYVGAPWPKRRRYSMPVISQYLWLRRKLFRRNGRLLRQDYFKRVGNGGLSLRKIESFIAVCDKYNERIEYFKQQKDSKYNEDWFWALIPTEFRYPTFEKALGFSFDSNPRTCYHLSKHKLPFGCHGWFKKRHIEFWAPIIEGK
ncbi:MAG: hypothetical protein IKY93_01800 [Alistipes sp.]|nr:hypothetical protein [Alistipes sp.]